jgi:type II secretory pathway component PulK
VGQVLAATAGPALAKGAVAVAEAAAVVAEIPVADKVEVVAVAELVAVVAAAVEAVAWAAVAPAAEVAEVAPEMNQQPKKRFRAKSPRAKQRRAMILVVVLVVVMMLALGAYAYTAVMRSHRESSVQTSRQLQAKLMVDSGIDYVRTFLLKSGEAQNEAGGRYNNPTFKQLPIVDDADPLHRGYTTIVSPALDDDGNLAGVRFGLEDESGRLNLNTLLIFEQQMGGPPAKSGAAGGASASAPSASSPSSSAPSAAIPSSLMQAANPGASTSSSASSSSARSLLMAIPGMTEHVADAILDWLDEDDDAREFGCESDYYATLNPPYAPKNGPLDTVEELLRVRGVTPQLLFGADANRNGQIDPNESAATLENQTLKSAGLPAAGAQAQGGATAPAGSMDRGWASYFTLHSRERNLTPDGKPRIYLNNPDLKMLYDELAAVFPQEWAVFIVAYRQGGSYSGATTTTQPLTAAGHQIDFNYKSQTNFTQVLDLVGAATQVKFTDMPQAIIVQSPFKNDIGAMNGFMPMLMDYVSVNPAATVPGRININQAPAAIIRGIPGMTPTVADQILTSRKQEYDPDKPNRRHETWLLTEGIVDITTMKLLQPFITCGGHVYRSQVVGYFQSGEAAARSEVIFDATGLLPRVVLWRDMSHLGRGYALETLGVDYAE